MKNMLIIGMLFLVLLTAGCASSSNSGATTANNSANSGAAAAGETKTFDIIAKQFEFSPSTITVNQGDNVVLNITSQDVTHGFSLPEFGVSELLEAGKTVHVNFVADKKGSFTFACSNFCGEGHSGMKGTLTIQ